MRGVYCFELEEIYGKDISDCVWHDIEETGGGEAACGDVGKPRTGLEKECVCGLKETGGNTGGGVWRGRGNGREE